MRYYLILLETIANERKIEILHSTTDGSEAVSKLAFFSDSWNENIVEGKCRVLMTTHTE